MTHRFHAVVAFAVAAGVSACRSLTDAADRPKADGYEDCTAGGLLAFFVLTRDSTTGAPVTDGAVLTWQAGRSTGTEVPGPGRTLPGGIVVEPNGIPGPYGRPGTYAVVVRAPGYREWRRTGVRVEQGAGHCEVRAIVDVEARLQRP